MDAQEFLEDLKEEIKACFLPDQHGISSAPKKYAIQEQQKNDSAPCWSRFGRVVTLPDLKLVEVDVTTEDDNETKLAHFVVCREPTCSTVYQYCGRYGTNAMNRHSCEKTLARKSKTAAAAFKNSDAVKDTQDIRKMMRSSKKPSQAEKQLMTKALTMWCATDLRPFEIVAGTGFHNVLQVVADIQARSKHKVFVEDLICHPTTIARNLIGMADEKRQILESALKKLAEQNIWRGFTTDLWTDDINKVAYISISVHYISADWKTQARTLCVKPFGDVQHTAINVLSSFTETLDSFNCTDYNNCIVTTDNGSNMAGQAGLESQFKRLPCADHKISTVLTTIFHKTTTTTNGVASAPFYRYQDDIGDVLELVEHSKALVRYFKQAELQSLLNTTLKQDNATRWNSVLTMLESVQRNRLDITNLLAAKRQMHRVTAIYGPLQDELIRFLTPFREATLALEFSCKPTLHLVCFWRYQLELHCSPIVADYNIINLSNEEEVIAKDSDSIVALKDIVKRVLTEKWKLHQMHILATLLDPLQRHRLTKKYKVDDRSVRQAKEELKSLMFRYVNYDISDGSLLSPTDTNSRPIEPERPTKRLRGPHAISYHDMSDDSDDDTTSGNERLEDADAVEVSINQEHASYFKYKLPKDTKESNYDIMMWWKKNEDDFPILSKVARSVLAIPASSAKSESNFSDAGNTITDKRNALGPHRVNDMLFLRSNNDLEPELEGKKPAVGAEVVG